MAIRNLLDALFPLYGLPCAQAAAELEMAAAAAATLARFFRRAERECAVKLQRREPYSAPKEVGIAPDKVLPLYEK